MKKSTKIIILVIVILAVAVGVFAFLNAGDLTQKKELEMNSEFIITQGDVSHTITMEDMLALDPETFTGTKDTSTTGPEEIEYTGVEFKTICDSIEIDLSQSADVQFSALDGYSSSVSIDDVLEDGNVYIVFEEEGQALGTKSDGGSGPYMMIINSSQFSQSWCKFLEEAIIR